MICPRCQQLVESDDSVWTGLSTICQKCHQKSKDDERKFMKISLIGIGIIVVMTFVALVLGAIVQNLAEE